MWCRSSALRRRLSFTGSSGRERCCCSLSWPWCVQSTFCIHRSPNGLYLCFLIPAIVVLLILASAVQRAPAVEGEHRRPDSDRGRGAWHHRGPNRGDRDAFNLQRMEGRYRVSAEVVRDRLPPNAVLITVWQSGSMRFHAGREIVMWESLDPSWLDRAITWLGSRDAAVLLFERREEPAFRGRFRGQSDSAPFDSRRDSISVGRSESTTRPIARVFWQAERTQRNTPSLKLRRYKPKAPAVQRLRSGRR